MAVRFEPDDFEDTQVLDSPSESVPVSLREFAARRGRSRPPHSDFEAAASTAKSVGSGSELKTPDAVISQFSKPSIEGSNATTYRKPFAHRAKIAQQHDDESEISRLSASELEQKLIWALNRKAMSFAEARSFLVDLGACESECDQLLKKVGDYGYLNDVALAQQHANRALARKSQSVNTLRRELSARGVSESDIAIAIDQLADTDYDRALAFALKKAPSLLSLAPEVAERRLYGQLARRGFSSAIVREVSRVALKGR